MHLVFYIQWKVFEYGPINCKTKLYIIPMSAEITFEIRNVYNAWNYIWTSFEKSAKSQRDVCCNGPHLFHSYTKWKYYINIGWNVNCYKCLWSLSNIRSAYNNFLTTNREVIVSIVSQNIFLFCKNKGF